MKTAFLLPLLGLVLACQKQETAPPAPTAPPEPLVSGRIVAVQQTTDNQRLHPRLRWALDLDPLTLPGWNGTLYPIAKTFSLPDTLTYNVGTLVRFHYRLVPREQETPWRTLYEWMSALPTPPGYCKNAEIVLSDVQAK